MFFLTFTPFSEIAPHLFYASGLQDHNSTNPARNGPTRKAGTKRWEACKLAMEPLPS